MLKNFNLLYENVKNNLVKEPSTVNGNSTITFTKKLSKEQLDKLFQLMGENNIIVYNNTDKSIELLNSSIDKALTVLKNKENKDVVNFKLFNCSKK